MKTKLFLMLLFAGIFAVLYVAAHMLTHTGHFYLNVSFVIGEGMAIGWLVGKLMNCE